jgi:prophage regulatory protein
VSNEEIRQEFEALRGTMFNLKMEIQKLQADDPDPPTRLLRRGEVESRVGLKKATIYRLMSLDRFPRPIQITDGTVGWVESEIESWVVNRIAAARGSTGTNGAEPNAR